MPDFPQIGCASVAQHPSSFDVSWPGVVQRSVDGSEQRFVRPGMRNRVWRIRLDRLGEADTHRVFSFFRSMKGRATSFRFLDPWSNVWHEPCWFATDELQFVHEDMDRLRGTLLITTKESI